MSNEAYRTIAILNERLQWYEGEAKRLRRLVTKLKSREWVAIVVFIGGLFMMMLAAVQNVQ